ncbi:MAG: MBL fold metallo-hydrolase [Candidatus Helarchaeota archaeon]
MKIKWVSHACFQITADSGKVLYTDPYNIPDGMEPADIILCSHDHYDHADAKAIKKIITKDTTVICPKSCENKLKKFSPKTLGIKSTIKEFIMPVIRTS